MHIYKCFGNLFPHANKPSWIWNLNKIYIVNQWYEMKSGFRTKVHVHSELAVMPRVKFCYFPQSHQHHHDLPIAITFHRVLFQAHLQLYFWVAAHDCWLCRHFKSTSERMTPLGREKSEPGNEALRHEWKKQPQAGHVWKDDHNTAAGVHRLTSLWTNHSAVRGCSGDSGVYESYSWRTEQQSNTKDGLKYKQIWG